MAENIKVLLVDDEPDILFLLEEVLKRRKYSVLVADSISNASKLLEQHKDIDIIISDIKMPEGTGIDLLKTIRAKDPIKPILVFLTAFTDISTEEIYNRGASGFIEKPIDIKVFAKTIEDLLKEAQLCECNVCDLYPCDKKINIKLKSIDDASLGTGGIFIPMPEIDFRLSEFVKLNITFENHDHSIIGIGKIEWIRRDSSKGPVGVGIKFINLLEETQEAIRKIVKQKGIISFIPNC
ncbi:MAG: response regulator [bacterium]